MNLCTVQLICKPPTIGDGRRQWFNDSSQIGSIREHRQTQTIIDAAITGPIGYNEIEAAILTGDGGHPPPEISPPH